LILNEETGISEPMHMLKRLEYRGYDSFGFASNTGFLDKHVGEIGRFETVESGSDSKARVFICHTRWATHGGVTEANAHPHISCDGKIAIVHNGIIENSQELRKMFEGKGHSFRSETDSEIIAHFFEEALKNGREFEEAIPDFLQEVKGTFATLIIRKGDDRIYAIKRDSPLVLGLLNSGFALASDIYAFSDRTNKAIFFEDNEFAVVDKDGYQFFNSMGAWIEKQTRTFEWSGSSETKKEYEHFMLKEIMEQPESSERLINSLKTEQKDRLEKLKGAIQHSKKVMFVCAGTSYHASLLGVYFLKKAGIDAQSVIASEFENYAMADRDTLVIAITQSGETMDVMKALKLAMGRGCRIASFVNVPYSSVQRMSETSIDIMAGQEVCVAATKSFVNQVIVLLHIASFLGYETGSEIMEKIPKKIAETIKTNLDRVKQLAKELSGSRDIYMIGRGMSYPVALEAALKIKEISYIHAEGMMGGELKHGTLALVEDGTPVISFIFNDECGMVSNTKEVEARGARTIIVSNHNNSYFNIPTNDSGTFVILSSIIGQLITYYIALEKDLPIDKPRSLAKSCTVE